eukprot:TRINITY_DN40257_c0_g1_i1.p1 TRINITY_DN40257_c0_g1~~TRINITY_DN40257_c0_g1_i1.p1  ORF type:complete len:455 (-),score=209.00 TRINITY_DN40257_c0_g1_i1:139-1503(-)
MCIRDRKKQFVLLEVARKEWSDKMDHEARAPFLEQYVELCEKQDVEVVWEEEKVKEEKKPKGEKRSRKEPKEPKAKAAKGPDGKKIKVPRPLSGYMTFAAEFRTTYVKATEDEKITEVMKAAGAAWKLLTDDQKEEYKQKGVEIFNEKQADKLAEEEEEKAKSSEDEDEEVPLESEGEQSEAEDEEEAMEEEDEVSPTSPSKRKAAEEEAPAKKKAKKSVEEITGAAAEEALEKKLAKDAAKQAADEVKKAKAAQAAEAKAAKAAEAEAKKAEKAAAKEEAERLNPKKPKTAFFFFLEVFRPEYKEQHSDASVSGVAAAGKAAWEALEEADKQKYIDQNAAATQLYQERCAALGIEAKVKELKPKKPKAPSAFELYASEKEDLAKRRYKVDGEALEAKLVLMWKHSSKSEKDMYKDKARLNKQAMNATAEPVAEEAQTTEPVAEEAPTKAEEEA